MASAGDSKPDGEVESHHIVAWRAAKARQSRLLLFAWRIAINDKDNGVHLPAYKRSQIASLPDAIKHKTIHTDIYHARVFLRLRAAAVQNGKQTEVGREALRAIKKQILNGTFPYRPEHLV